MAEREQQGLVPGVSRSLVCCPGALLQRLWLPGWKASDPVPCRASPAACAAWAGWLWGVLLFYFWEGTETHSTKVGKAEKLSEETYRNTRNEVTCKLEVQPA